MKVQILSDLHNEFLEGRAQSRGDFNYKTWTGNIPQTDADIIVLAGDIDIGARGIKWAVEESNRLDKKIIYVSGNHEYYSREYFTNLKNMRDAANDSNVYFLENNEIQIDGIRILGSTLWTDYNVVPGLDTYLVMKECGHALNDHRVIRIAGDNEYFSPKDARRIHIESVNWLKSKLNEDTDCRATLVVTHHGPSELCQHIKYPVSPISAAFHSDLTQLVEKADCWVYGHTHSNLDVMVGKCRLVSNQSGYPREDVPDFNSIKIVEL